MGGYGISNSNSSSRPGSQMLRRSEQPTAAVGISLVCEQSKYSRLN